MIIQQLELLSYNQISDYVIKEFKREFGSSKFEKVYDKVINSNKVRKLFEICNEKSMPPGSEDVIYTINSIPYFMFTSNRAQILACVLIMNIWDERYNSFNYFLTDEGFHLRFMKILKLLNVHQI